jgi:twinkle protein
MKKGVDGVMVDPFNQLDHNQKAYQREDQYLSEVLKEMKRFALLNAVVYCLVAHPKNPPPGLKGLPIVDMYDISGGAMWGNKTDLILSYHRPNFHENKNSPEVEIHVQKVKRKRTGGKLGHFPLRLLWNKKRYEEDSGAIPCDPRIANGEKIISGIQGDMWLPYKDDNDTEVGF